MAAAKKKLGYYEATDKLKDGQIAIAEVHPDHPFVPSGKPTVEGEHQVYIVRGDKKCGGAWAARTADVRRAVAYGYLEEVDPPEGTPEPLDGPPTVESARIAEIKDNRQEAGTYNAPVNPVVSGADLNASTGGDQGNQGEASGANPNPGDSTSVSTDTPVVATDATATDPKTTDGKPPKK